LDDFYFLQLDKLDRYICLRESGVVIAEDEASSSDEDDEDDDEDTEGEDDLDDLDMSVDDPVRYDDPKEAEILEDVQECVSDEAVVTVSREEVGQPAGLPDA
jgi:hypothetical protein